ncbi:MAG: PspA/IM30 family protein [Pseudomonadota bacterium]
MLKQFLTLARGRSADATSAVMDANALSILRQQLRDASTAVERSRKALAVVMAYAEREKASLIRLEEQIGTLETRALAALEKDREDLALEASEAIADLEAEATATRNAIETYSAETTRLRNALKDSEAKLVDLKRGQRLAEANDKAIKLRGALPNVAKTDLEDAADTLKQLQARQDQAHATAKAMTQLSTQMKAETLDDRMAAAGCGYPKKSSGTAVLDRLKASQSSK